MADQRPREQQPDKTIIGYCEPWSLRAGEPVGLHASGRHPGPARLDVVRVICGDPTRSGPGFAEQVIETDLPDSITLDEQPLRPGSWGSVDLDRLSAQRRLRLELHLQPWRTEADQSVASMVTSEGASLVIGLRNGRFVAQVDRETIELDPATPAARRWYRLDVDLTLEPGIGRLQIRGLTATVTTAPSRSPARDLTVTAHGRVEQSVDWDLAGEPASLLLARSPQGRHFDGRISRPRLTLDDVVLSWDLGQDIPGRAIVDTSGNERHGLVHQLPARAVTGPDWDSTVQDWRQDPSHYDAIHFHHDDLYDAQWDQSAALELPADLPSGIYAFRVSQERDGRTEIDRVPFFVRPARDAPTADVALLLSTCTYMAYANHRMLFEGADFIGSRAKLRPEHEYIRQHPELGRSHYEKHPDGSGVMYSSRRRPVLNLRPGADGWNFTPDTDVNAFLTHTEIGHDIITDEDVHHEGLPALAPYRVIVTSTHPEYWSTDMLDALDAWQRQGGRLMYLGGNGFYWRIAFSDTWPGAIELRRTEDGVRNWQTGPGESYHSFGGEYGGLWRRLGRAPNELVGIGFAAQGFERATYYERSEASHSDRVSWIFDGVDGERFGTSGLGGGAAGQEIDRFDPRLGSPAHGVVVASATDFGPDMVRTKEEFEASIVTRDPDPLVRADVVFAETPGGGALFSVGSISWFGALARDGYDNDVATITTNVLRRFADPALFPPPPPTPSSAPPPPTLPDSSGG